LSNVTIILDKCALIFKFEETVHIDDNILIVVNISTGN
jgi:hypothetical protein